MTGAVLGNGPTQKSTAYRYDPNGIRRSQQITAAGGAVTRTEYLVDPNQAYAQVLEEWGASAASGPLPDETLATTYVYGDDLISQTKLALAGPSVTSVYHYDGLGTTRALSAYKVDAAGAPQLGHGEITDRYAYTAFGESDPAGTSGDTSGSSENNYRYTGEQLDPNLGFYYLRARYMDPGQGRFVGMDPYAGDDRIPISAHDYLYAGLDPVGRLDPTGMFTLSDLVGSMNIRGTLNTIGQVNFRNFAKNTVTGTMRTARALLNEAKVCFRTPRKCQLKVPVLIVGMETPETSQHIQDAILNENSATNIVHSPFWLTRKSPPHSRHWLRSNTNCAGRVRGVTSCDEYPFASTEEGGSGNQLRVSLRLVPVREQSLQGGLLSAFYTACRISTTRTSSNPIHDKRTFLVVPTPQSPGFPLCLR